MAVSRDHGRAPRRLRLFLSVGVAVLLALGPTAGASVTERTLWVTRYDHHQEVAGSIAVNSDGSTVFVTGWSTGKGSGKDYATVAFDAPTGTTLWVKRYNGPGNGGDGASSDLASPDGSVVFVTGTSKGESPSVGDYATLAYEVSTGATRWARRYSGRGNYDFASSLAVSPSGSKVF